jgi:autotransporter passenger strand-loop-strand repeat protein
VLVPERWHPRHLGTAVGTTVSSGGSEIVYSGGTASNTIVSSGGSLVVLSHGIADPATIYNGGSESTCGAPSGVDPSQISGCTDGALDTPAFNQFGVGGETEKQHPFRHGSAAIVSVVGALAMINDSPRQTAPGPRAPARSVRFSGVLATWGLGLSLSARVTATRCFFSGVGTYERWA